MTTPTPPKPDPALPVAVLRPERRASLAWLVPIGALALVAWIAFAAWRDRGYAIVVDLPDGHGIKAGDPVRHRGIDVGRIEEVRLTDDLQGVRARVRLERASRGLAVAGTRFWVVRPRLALSGVQGLETLVGPRYLAVAPEPVSADGPPPAPRRFFVGLAAAPAVERHETGDLQLILDAARRGGLQPGSPVTHRQVRIGTVLSAGLSSDGSRVEVRVHVERQYRALVREGTRFWFAGGLRTNVGIGGVSLEMDSLQEFVTGGIALATPPPEDAGDAVLTGHRFTLHDEADDDWLEWRSVVPIGSSLLPAGAARPSPLRAAVRWKQGMIFKGTKSREGWVLQLEDGLVGPADVLAPDLSKRADEESLSLEVGGQAVVVGGAPEARRAGVALVEADVATTIWPRRRVRALGEPEDCLVFVEPGAEPVPLAATRLTMADGAWSIDEAMPFGADAHGACVLSRTDGALVGLVLVDDDGARVAPIPREKGN